MRKNPLSNMSAHGGIITSEFLENLRNENVQNPRVLPASFAVFGGAGPSNKRELDQQISEAWEELLERWDSISSHYLRMDVSEARSKWIIPLLRGLGFDPVYNKQDIIIEGNDELKFRLSHKAWADVKAPMIHTVAPSQDLEEKPLEETESSRRERRRSPHDELQAYLNLNKVCKWGIVTNGILLRILREFYHTTTKGYVEFDIENVFRERSFTDFRVLYRLTHASRFLQDSEGMCHLEQFYKESVAAGVAVGENLRKNVKKAIEALGNGFLTAELADKMIEDEEFCKNYYAELLKAVYRILFLLFAEQRAMLPTRDSIYADEYSMNRLREISETRKGKDEHSDLWEGLKVTFHMLKTGCPELKVFGYNGSLFEDEEIPILSSLTCKNSDTLAAVRYLTVVEEERVLKRINYLDLGVEEIGSIYESLLDFTPRVTSRKEEVDGEKVPAKTFFLDPRGTTRKTTGSYYTDRRLIDELIKSALKSVVEDRLAKSLDKERALLSVKVCDPACGSGAFLIAATNYMARELAKIRTRQDEPPDKEVRKARRDVLQHCIYGVDLNPMAVELAKVSLWINSCVEDMPLNFLDHHIKCGDSLVGSSLRLLEGGLPNEAFTPVTGDDKGYAKGMQKINSLQKGQRLMLEYAAEGREALFTEYAKLSDLGETIPNHVQEKKQKYAGLLESPQWVAENLALDAWVAAFFWPLRKDAPQPPTSGILRTINGLDEKIAKPIRQMIGNLASQYRFFHWHLEFPDVFQSPNKGFDCILGNPPWEGVKVDEIEYFSARLSDRFRAMTKVDKQKEIESLLKNNVSAAESWARHCRRIEKQQIFYEKSGRFPLASFGKKNTFPLFIELCLSLLGSEGRMGMIVKSAIATDNDYNPLFRDICSKGRLVSFYDFENRLGLFPGVHRMERFALLTIGDSHEKIHLGFNLKEPDSVVEPSRIISVSVEELAQATAKTFRLPVVQNLYEFELLRRIYTSENLGRLQDINDEWRIDFSILYDSGKLSEVGKTLEDLAPIQSGARIFAKAGDGTDFVGVYEAKYFDFFDHRYADFEGIPREKRFGKTPRMHYPSPEQKRSPSFELQPRYWVPRAELDKRLLKLGWKWNWLTLFGRKASANNSRTLICSLVPRVAFCDTAPALIFQEEDGAKAAEKSLLITGLMSTYVLDFIVRRRMVGTTIGKNLIFELAFPKLSWIGSDVKGQYLRSHIIKLVHQLVPNVRSLSQIRDLLNIPGQETEVWEPDTRLKLIAQLNAMVARIYLLSKEDLSYILDTFQLVKKEEEESFGEYRTKRLILSYYDELVATKQVSK